MQIVLRLLEFLFPSLPGLLPGADRDLVRPLQNRLQGFFEAIHLNTKVSKLEATGDAGEHIIAFARTLAAWPPSDEIGLLELLARVEALLRRPAAAMPSWTTPSAAVSATPGTASTADLLASVTLLRGSDCSAAEE